MPIISRSDYEKVQKLMALNAPNRNRRQIKYPLSKKIKCGLCGRTYIRNLRKATNGAEVIDWICHNDSHNHPTCKNNAIHESDIVNAYKTMIAKLQANNIALLDTLLKDMKKLAWHDESEAEIAAINKQMISLAKQSKTLFRLRSELALDADVLMDKADELERQINKLKEHKNALIKNQLDASPILQMEHLIKRITGIKAENDIDYDEMFEIAPQIEILPEKTVKFTLCNGLRILERGC